MGRLCRVSVRVLASWLVPSNLNHYGKQRAHVFHGVKIEDPPAAGELCIMFHSTEPESASKAC